MTGWGFVDRVYAAWVEGDGVDLGIPGGLLYEGNNPVLWRGDDGEMQFNLASIERPIEETHATMLTGTDEGGQVWSSWLTFESPGCWQISAEQGDNRVDATVVVYPTACRQDSFDLEDCPVPPYSLYWEPEQSTPTDCDVTTVASLMTGFIDAVNRHDVESAVAFFPDRDQDTDIDTTGLRWFSLEKMVAGNPAELRSLLAALIDEGEQLRLLHLGVHWDWQGGATFHVVMTRETDDLLRYQIEGKAAANCELGRLYVFSAGRQ
jgi:hypothetical protein